MPVLDKIKEKIENAISILIITHENPDGDAIGSSLAFFNGLKKLGKSVTVLIPEFNSMYNFLPGAGEIQKEVADENASYDLCIALDSSDVERLHVCKKFFQNAKDTIVIDHHITNQNFGSANYVNAVASSTCQNLMVVMGIIDMTIDKDIAECLYAGILADTGGFRYNVQPETFEMVATLLETGIDIAKIYRLINDITTEKKVRLLAKALDRLEVLEDGKIAFTYITADDCVELQSEDGDQENIVNYGRNIDGVEVSIFIREKDGGYKVSLRSNSYVDVSLISAKYAGGGHIKAAGFELMTSFEQAKMIVVSEIKKQLKN